MNTLIISLIFLGSYFSYSTSKKAILNSDFALNRWVTSNIKFSKIIGILLLLASLILSIVYFGTTSGILFWLISLLIVLGLIIIITPLKKLTYKHILILFLIILTFEFIL